MHTDPLREVDYQYLKRVRDAEDGFAAYGFELLIFTKLTYQDLVLFIRWEGAETGRFEITPKGKEALNDYERSGADVGYYRA